MRVRSWRIALAAGLAAGLAAAPAMAAGCGGPPPPPDRRITFESEVTAGRLSNGLHVLVDEDHSTNLVELGVRVEVGSSSDPEGKAGLAHLVEHLMFQVRSADRPIAADFSDVALRLNALTDWDSTHFTTTARADQLDYLLQLEALRFDESCASIPEETFEREREVVRNELRQKASWLVESSLTAVLESAYPAGHPYHRSIIGDDAQLSALTLADACDFVDANYRPDRMSVVVSGDVDTREALAAIDRHLGSLAGTSRADIPEIPKVDAGGHAPHHTSRGSDRRLIAAWSMPPRGSAEYAAARIALELIEYELRRSHGYLASGLDVGGARAPLAVLSIWLDDDDGFAEAIAALWAAVAEAAKDDGSYRLAYLVDHLVNRTARHLLEQFDSRSARVRAFADTLQFSPTRHPFVDVLKELDALTPATVTSAVGALYSYGNATVLEVEPDEDLDLNIEQSELSYRGRSHEADAWTAPIDPAEARVALDLPVVPSTLELAERYQLDNGLTVVMLRTPTAPIVEAHLVFSGGSADDPEGQTGLAYWAAALLGHKNIRTSGAKDTAVATALYRFGDSLGPNVHDDHTVFSARGLSSHVDALLAGLSSLVQNGVYRIGKRDDEDAGDTDLADEYPFIRLERALYESVYGPDHPYTAANGFYRAGADTSRDDLERHRDRYFTARNGVLVITGQFDVALTKKHVKHWLGELRSGAAIAIDRPDAAARSGRVVRAFDDDEQLTTRIEIAYPIARDDARVGHRRVMAELIDERVARVRHELGAAYFVSASYDDNVGPGMLRISAVVDAARADEALVALLGELDAMRDPGTDLSESFARARRTVLRRLLADESGARETGARLVALSERGRPLDYYTNLAKRVMRLTIDDLRPTLGADLAIDREFIGLLGPAESNTKALSAAALPQ